MINPTNTENYYLQNRSSLIQKILLLKGDRVKELTSGERDIIIKIFREMNDSESRVIMSKKDVDDFIKLNKRLTVGNTSKKKESYFSNTSRAVQNALGLRVSSDALKSEIEAMQTKVQAQENKLFGLNVSLFQVNKTFVEVQNELSKATKLLDQEQQKWLISGEKTDAVRVKKEELEKNVNYFTERCQTVFKERWDVEKELKKTEEEAKKLGIDLKKIDHQNSWAVKERSQEMTPQAQEIILMELKQKGTLAILKSELLEAKKDLDDAKKEHSQAIRALGQEQARWINEEKQDFKISSEFKELSDNIGSLNDKKFNASQKEQKARKELEKAVEESEKLGINVKDLGIDVKSLGIERPAIDSQKNFAIYLSKKNESKISKIIQQTINQERELRPRALGVKSKIVLDEKVINIYYEKLKMQSDQLSRDNNLGSLSTTSEYQAVVDLKSFLKGEKVSWDFLKELGFYCIIAAKRKDASPIPSDRDSNKIKKDIEARQKSIDPQDEFALDLSKDLKFQKAAESLVVEVSRNSDLSTLLIEFKKITKDVADYCKKNKIKLPDDSPLEIMKAILIAANIAKLDDKSSAIINLCKLEEANVMNRDLFLPSDLQQHLMSWIVALSDLSSSTK